MSVLEDHATMSGSFHEIVGTEAATDQSLASAARDEEAKFEGWQRIIDDYLIEWGRDPGQLADEDLSPPSKHIIGYASRVAIELRKAGWPPPLRVVPDGEGGIAFERRSGDFFQSLEIRADETIELSTFKDCRLQSTLILRIDM